MKTTRTKEGLTIFAERTPAVCPREAGIPGVVWAGLFFLLHLLLTGICLAADPPPGMVPGVIFYTRTGGQDGVVWAANGDGSADAPVTMGGFPRVSPDGRYMLFLRNGALLGQGDLWMKDLVTGQETFLFDNTDYIIGTDWTLDGSRFYFDHSCQIFSRNRDSTGAVTVRSVNCYDDAPVVRPGTGQIAWHNVSNGSGLWLASSNGSGAVRITNSVGTGTAASSDIHPAWSPDGEWLAFINTGDYFKMRPDGTGRTNLSALAGVSIGPSPFGPSPAWTRDGIWIVAGLTVNGANSLYALATDGSGAMRRLGIQPGGAAFWVGNVITNSALNPQSAAALMFGWSASPSPARVGGPLVLTVGVTNFGGLTASNVVVTNLLPAGVNYVSATTTQGSASQAGGVVVAQLGQLAPNASARVDVTVVPTTNAFLTFIDSLAQTSPEVPGSTIPKSQTNTVLAVNGFVGNITVPGERDVFTFSLGAETIFYFDALTSQPNLIWTLTGPQGVVASRYFTQTDGNAIGGGAPILRLVRGDYTITIEATAAATPPYAFNLVDLASATLITPGAPVSTTMTPANKTDFYQFTALAGDRIQLDQTSRVNLPGATWRLVDPIGNVILHQNFSDSSVLTLSASGTYTLLVEGDVGNTGTATYSFNVVPQGNTPPAPFTGTPFAIGDLVVSNYVTGTTNFHIFTVPERALLLFDTQTNSTGVDWTLETPWGVFVSRRGFNSSDRVEGDPVLDLPAGDYRISVRGSGSNPYRFRLVDLATATPLSIGSVVTTNLIPANATLAYVFTNTPGSRLFFDRIAVTNLPNLHWRIFDPFGKPFTSLNFTTDLGIYSLPLASHYYLVFEGYYQDTYAGGGFSFSISPITDGSQALALDTTVEGAITSPGQVQRYTFTLGAESWVYFDSLTNLGNIRWSLDGPQGNLVNNRPFTSSDGQNGFSLLNLPPADYTLTVSAAGDDTAGYQFRLLKLASGMPLTPGVPVNGSLSVARETDIYRFNATAGSRVYFDWLSGTISGNTYLRLIDPRGAIVFTIGAYSDNGPRTLDASGTYTLLVEGYVQDATGGNYNFNLAPVTDGAQALALNTTITGSLASPGQVQRHTFTLTAPAFVYFDSLTNRGDVRWSLDGSGGNLVSLRGFNGSDGQNGFSLLNLPPGSYTLAVSGSAETTGGYQFRLLDLATAAPITPGIVVSNALDVAKETDLYRFNVTAGSRYYFDWLGGTVSGNTHWRLLDPLGNLVLNAGVGDSGVLTLAESGTYTLTIEGYVHDASGGNYSFNVIPVVDGAEAFAVSNTVTGAVSTPGQVQRHNFSVASPTRLYFDSLTNNGEIRWSLDGPLGNLVLNRAFTSSDGPNGYSVFEAPAGDYTVTVSGSGDATGGYRFRILDFAEATLIATNSTINGSLNPGNETKLYRFTAAAGDRIRLDYLSKTQLPNAFWRLADPYGAVVNNAYFNTDSGVLSIGAAGNYTLSIEGQHSDLNAGTFSFTVSLLSNVPPAVLTGVPLVIGSTISGNLATAASVSNYLFTLAEPATLAFDVLTNVNFAWSLRGPPGLLVNNRGFLNTDGSDGNSIMALPAGEYQLSITGVAGDYEFRLLDFASAIPFALGNVVSNALSPADSTILYQFTGTAGERVYFDGRPTSGFSYTPTCRLYGPLGNLISSFGVSSDVNTFTLPNSGTYVLTVEGRIYDNNASGNYAFNLFEVHDGTNALTIGATVSGSVTTLGQAQRYFFSLSAPAQIYFDSLTNADFYWRLDNPWKQIQDWKSFAGSDANDGFSLLALGAGDYVLTVAANSFSFTGSYEFRLLYFTNTIPFTLGTVVSNTLAPADCSVFYRFSATAGQRVYFDGRPTSGFSYAPYCRLYGPAGNYITAFNVSGDVQTFELSQSGDYLLTLEGRVYDQNPSGSYSFNLFEVHDGTNALTIGATVNGAIATLGEAQRYFFSLATPARLYFDSLTNADFYWRLDAPWGQIVDWRSFGGSDGQDFGNPLLALGPGDYTLTVAANSYSFTGNYLFRLLDFANASPFVPGNVVSGSLAPARSTVFYQFNGTAGDRYFFDGLPSSGFTYNPYVRIYAPLGNIVMAQTANNDVDTFTLPQSGVYTLTVEGRIYDGNAGGNFNFNLVPNPPQPSTPLFQTNNAPDLIVTTVSVTPPTGLQSGQSATVNWTVQNAGNAAVNSSFTDRVLVRNTGYGQVIVNNTLPYDVSAGGPLGPGDTRNRSLNILLPDGAAGAGLLEVTVTTDTLNNVAEQNALATGEANNATVINITTTVAPYPDLQIHSLNVTPLTGWTPGTLVSIQWRLTNAGPRATSNSWTDNVLVRNASTAQFLVSTTTNYDASALGNLAPGDVRDRLLTFTVPNSAAAYGQFEISVTADSAGQVFEFASGFNAETNNTAQLITTSAPDLQVTGLGVTANPSFQSGASLTAQWNTVNNGNVYTGQSFYDRLRVRNTNTAEVLLDTSILYNPAVAGNGPIAPGGSRARSHTFTLPDGPRAVGELEVSVTADAFNNLLELNGGGTGEANNGATVFVTTALAPYPDLQVANLRAVPAVLLSGDTMQIQWQDTNSGTRATVGSWWDRVVVVNTSLNLTLLDNQVYYDQNILGPLTNGTARDRSYSFALPDSTNAVGHLQITITADRYNSLFEFVPGRDAETNNTATIAQSVALSAYPDLRVVNVTVAPALPFSGSDITVSWRVTNGGNAAVSGSFSDRVTVRKPSTGLVLGAPTVLYDATQPTNGLIGVGESRQRQLTFRLPDGTNGSGSLQVEVSADTFAQIVEINSSGTGELNNTTTNTFNSSLTAYPDLVAGNVLYPANGIAATPVSVSWSVTNIGPGGTLYGWSEQVFLSDDAAIGADQLIATFAYTNSLAPGQSISRTQSVTLPLFGSGNRWFVVRIDSADSVFEINEANNSALGASPISTPLGATLSLSPATVSEGGVATATLTRNGGVSNAASFALASFNTNRVAVPASLSFAINQAAASFYVTSVEDTLVLGNVLVPIVASAAGYLTASNALSVLEDDEPTLAVQLSLSTVVESAGFAATVGFVTRNTDTNAPLTVALISSDANKAFVPSSLVIPAGARSAFFDVGVVGNSVPNVTARVTLTATATGFRALPATLNITDDDTPALMLALDDLAVSEGAANPATTLTITRSPVTDARARFIVQSSNPGSATVPYNVTIQPSSASVAVPVQVVNNGFVDGPRTVRFTIYATDDVLGTPILDAVATTNLVVTDDDGPTLSVRVAAEVIAETGSTTGTVTRNTAVTSNLVVSLASSLPGEATVPPTVTILSGAASADFPINGVVDGAPDGTKRVNLTAATAGFNSGVGAVNVSDIDLPDLRPVAVSATNTALTATVIPISFTVTNSGLSDADGVWVDRVYLATSPAGDGLTPVGQASQFAGLALRGSYTKTVAAATPANPGQYYIVVFADAAGAVNEGSKQNNRFISATPLNINPAYRAEIATDVDATVAGTTIPLHGRAYNSVTLAPTPNVPVTVRILVRGTRRTFTAYADALGNIDTFFQPLPSEAGHVSLAADHPGVVADTVQDTVDIFGVRFGAYDLTARVFPNIPVSNAVEIINLGDLPLTGLSVTTDAGVPDFLSVTFDATNTLAASGRMLLNYTIATTNVVNASVRTRLRVATAEGATATVPITINVQPLTTTLVATPGVLDCGIARGAQKIIEFEVGNIGGIPSGNINVLLPQLPWVALSSPSNVPSLGPGETNKITLVLTPPGDTPLTRYDANIFLDGENGDLLVPVRFRIQSLATGDLNVEVLDDYTYYVDGAPKVTNATVRLTDPLTGATVAERTTFPAGTILFTNLMEGTYQMRVTAPQHTTYASPIDVVAGVQTDRSVFIDRQTVTYRWTVVPTTIEDRYQIVLEPVFQTEVPIPVVTLDNPKIRPIIKRGGQGQIELRLSNHGLVAAERVTITPPQDPYLEITPLVEVVDVLPAMSSIAIPVRIRSKVPAAGAGGFTAAGVPDCGKSITGCDAIPKMEVKWSWICGPDRRWHGLNAEIEYTCVDPNCWEDIQDLLRSKLEGIRDDLLDGETVDLAELPLECICDIINVVAVCLGITDPCALAVLQAACGVATRDFGTAAGGAAGFGNCFCPNLPSLPSFNSPPPGPPPVYTTTVYNQPGPPGNSGRPIEPWIGWDYQGADCDPGLHPASARSPFQAAATRPGGVCARVRIRLEQEAALTRAAFLGTLELENESADTPLTGVRITLDIRDEQGNSANDKFSIRGPELTGLSAVDGSGVVGTRATGSARYTFVPTREAAPTAPKLYRFGGSLAYTAGPDRVEVPLAPEILTVYPDPVLTLDYFLQRDVYSDDPFTVDVEPAEPFALGLLVRNTGKGKAVDFRITSAQPKIIENEKGLLIDFKIIGTQVSTSSVTPSLSLRLGDIDAGKAQVAAFFMTASLQGKFIEYNASFKHINPLGDDGTSLIDAVNLHELNHVVRADRPGDDAAMDFLVNDVPDADRLPDTLFFSNGSMVPVELGSSPMIDAPPTLGDFQVQLTANMPAGWAYLKMPDPGPYYRLFRVVRSDGKEILVGTNAWTTDRSFPSALAGAVRENLLHLLDFNSTGAYTLYYQVKDSVAPIILSAGAGLAALQTGPVSTVDIVTSETIDLLTFTRDDLVLTRNGGANLINSGVTVTNVGTNVYRISGLAPLTGLDGNYELTVMGSGIIDYGANPLTSDGSVAWAKGVDAPVVVSITKPVPDPRNVGVTNLDVTFTKAVDAATFSLEDIVLARNGGPNLITAGVTITARNATTFRLGGLEALTSAEGTYVLTVFGSGVTGQDASAGLGSLSQRWTVLSVGPALVSLEAPTPTLRNIVVQALDVTFDRAINPATFDWRDVTLTRDGGANLITSDVTVTRLNDTTYRLGNFSWVQGLAGTYSMTVSGTGVQDAAGNFGSGVRSQTWTLELTKPAAPFNVFISPDLGVSPVDGRTASNNVTLGGMLGETNLTVRVYDDTLGLDLGTAIINGTSFAKALSFDILGAHALRLYAVDAAQNVSSNVSFNVFIDQSAPTAALQAITPVTRETPVASLDITLSEAVNQATFTRDLLTLTRDGGANLITPAVTLSRQNDTLYRLNNLTALNTNSGNYLLTLQFGGVQDLAGNTGAGSVTRVWTIRAPSSNRPPMIAVITNRAVNEGTRLTIPVVASDPDLPPQTLTYALGGTAPAGSSLDAATGVFVWRPTSLQGPGTYTIVVIASDNGQPSLSATQTFQVTVKDALPDVVVSLGQTNLFSGQTSSVPIRLDSGLSVTNLAFDIEASPSLLTNFVLQSPSLDVLGAALQPLGGDRSRVVLALKPGVPAEANRTLLRLGFAATASDVSGVVNASVNAVQATRDTGAGVANTAGTVSRIVVVGRQPVLLPGAPPPLRTLLLQGRPGTSYQIECTTNLGPGAVWSLVSVIALSNIVQTVVLPPTSGNAFYRVRALTGGAARIEPQSSGPNIVLLLQGTVGETFRLQTTTNLGPGANWQTIATVGLSNAFQPLTLPRDGVPERFYRLTTP